MRGSVAFVRIHYLDDSGRSVDDGWVEELSEASYGIVVWWYDPGDGPVSTRYGSGQLVKIEMMTEWIHLEEDERPSLRRYRDDGT